jgi:abhydrolase domain-containing protein 12
MESSTLKFTLLTVVVTLCIPAIVYLTLLGVLITVPSLQAHALYLHRITLTWFKDLNVPEQFGFQHNQATPFHITTDDDVILHVWHVLPLGAYWRNYEELIRQGLPAGSSSVEFTQTLNFRLLRDDPEARLVIYMHGTSGTLASGWRPDSYRALPSAAPDKIHVLTFDYRGYGLSSGTPSEPGLLTDAITVFSWATEVAGVPPERIVIFGQSLGSAVAIALVNHLAVQNPPMSCAGLVVTASFSDVAALTATYRIGGVIPVLAPLAMFQPLFDYFTSHLHSTWLNKDRVAEFVRKSHRYHITLIHAEDDPDIPAAHTESLFWHAINATSENGMSYEALETKKEKKKTKLGEGGWFIEWPTEKGYIRQDMLKYGVHDKIMSYPVVGMAVLRAFQAMDPQLQG